MNERLLGVVSFVAGLAIGGVGAAAIVLGVASGGGMTQCQKDIISLDVRAYYEVTENQPSGLTHKDGVRYATCIMEEPQP